MERLVGGRGLLVGSFVLAGIASAVLFAGCSSWFQTRVEQKDARIEALEQEREEAETPEDQERLDEAIADEREDRKKSLEGVLEEQKNKQAFLMALIAMGVGGLKVAAGLAAKGVI